MRVELKPEARSQDTCYVCNGTLSRCRLYFIPTQDDVHDLSHILLRAAGV